MPPGRPRSSDVPIARPGPVTDVDQIGVALRYARQQLGMTVEQVAARSGYGVAFVRGIETGRQVPSVHTLMNLLQTLDQQIVISPRRGQVAT